MNCFECGGELGEQEIHYADGKDLPGGYCRNFSCLMGKDTFVYPMGFWDKHALEKRAFPKPYQFELLKELCSKMETGVVMSYNPESIAKRYVNLSQAMLEEFIKTNGPK